MSKQPPPPPPAHRDPVGSPSPEYLAALTHLSTVSGQKRAAEAAYYEGLATAAVLAPGRGDLAVRAFRAEAATLLRVHERQIDADLSLAHTLHTEFPALLQALSLGEITVQHARKLAQAAAPIGNTELKLPPPGALPAAEGAALVGEAAIEQAELIKLRRAEFAEVMLPHARVKTPQQLVPIARKLVEEWTVDTIQQRHQRAAVFRNIRVYEADDGMADLVAHLPAVMARAIVDRASRVATQLLGDDPRSMDEKRADAFIATTLGCPHPGKGGEPVPGVGELLLTPADVEAAVQGSDTTGPDTTGLGTIGPDTTGPDTIGLDAAGFDAAGIESALSAVNAAAPVVPAALLDAPGSDPAPHRTGSSDTTPEHASLDHTAVAARLRTAGTTALERALAIKAHIQLVVRADVLDKLLANPPNPPNSGDSTGAPGTRDDSPPGRSEPAPNAGEPAPLIGHAELVGYGPITIDAALPHLTSTPTWDRVLVHPDTGAVLTSTAYRPPAHLRRLLAARDVTCRFPGCSVSVYRSDFDHTVPAAAGGVTSTDNLKPLCRGHHTMKHHGGWADTQHPGGVIVWNSPAGHVYTEYPVDKILEDHIPERYRPNPAGLPPAMQRLADRMRAWEHTQQAQRSTEIAGADMPGDASVGMADSPSGTEARPDSAPRLQSKPVPKTRDARREETEDEAASETEQPEAEETRGPRKRSGRVRFVPVNDGADGNDEWDRGGANDAGAPGKSVDAGEAAEDPGSDANPDADPVNDPPF